MWKNAITRIAVPLLKCDLINTQQLRTTFILKRRWPPGLHKINSKPKTLKSRHYVYDLVKDTNIEKYPELDLILTTYVDGYGNTGDRIQVKSNIAYDQLLLPGLATYATPENIEKYKNITEKKEQKEHSSAYAQRTVNLLSRYTLTITMNKDNPWTLESWHVRACFRKGGYHVADEAIELPKKPIKGPDLSLENKEFFVTVTINNVEKVQVRCRIRHWSTEITEKLQHVPEHWKIPRESLFPEDAPILNAMPSKHIVQLEANIN